MRKVALIGVLLVIGVGVVLALGWLMSSDSPRKADATAEGEAHARRLIETPENDIVGNAVDEAPNAESDESADEEPQTEEEKAEAAEEAAVEAFDALTDKWMEPAAAKVDMKAIAAFTEMFRKVPEPRRDECIHRALNLVPDENVMLLAGVLMDKSMPKEIVETVFNDILNRDEDVKKPILQEIFKDKSHPCWADTAWILDVTGEIKQEKE